MFALFLISLFIAVLLSATAHLQSKSRWWSGLLAALGLFVFGWIVAMLVPDNVGKGQVHPAYFVTFAAWWSAVIVAIGSGAALVLRRGRFADRIAVIVFFAGWLTTIVLFMFVGFWVWEV